MNKFHMARPCLVLLLFTTSCPQITNEPKPSAAGSVSGTLAIFRGANTAKGAFPYASLKSKALTALNRAPSGTLLRNKSELLDTTPGFVSRPLPIGGGPTSPVQKSRIRRGEVIVRFREKISSIQAQRQLQVNGVVFSHGGFASEYLHLARYHTAEGGELSEEQTYQLVAALQNRAGVVFTELNGIRTASVTPNDKFYNAMWHLPAINLPAAWDIEKGSTKSVVVAVIDTGYVPHPDLQDQLLPGYDMISDTEISNDGDGRDSEALDPGKDQPQGRSSYHGTHCAGTIGASTNNGAGVSGVNWNARIVPVRVLGIGGGTDFDIAAGMSWAVGLTVPGVPANANPATVVNMSLGGESAPRKSYQDVIDAAAATQTVFVVAAGNENIEASRSTPCNQDRVLCIGATRFNGKRSSFSNYGTRIDLMAPGGEMEEDANGDDNPDGVLSLGKDDADNQYVYRFSQGTSMAAPHIAGVVSLMKARVPTATFDQIKAALQQTANADGKCTEGCGAGLVNVLGALQQISGAKPTGPAKMSLSAAELFFTRDQSQTRLQITNSGAESLEVQFALSGTEKSRIQLSEPTLTVPGGSPRSITLDGNVDGLPTGTTVSVTLTVTSNGGNATVNLKLGAQQMEQPAAVALVYQDANDEWQIETTATAMPPDHAWILSAKPGKYYVFGAQDSNGNQMYEENEPIGLYPSTESPKELSLNEGVKLTGLKFTLSPYREIGEDTGQIIGAACTDNAMCAPGRCVTAFPNGYCTQLCTVDACPLGSRCVSIGTDAFCLAACSGARSGRSNCREGYVCDDDGTGAGICLPACKSDTDCEPSTCNLTTGYCE